MRRTRIVVLAACLALLVAVPPRAADPTVPEKEETGLRMSLADCLRTGLEKNLDLVIARKDPLIAEQKVEAQNAPFDPNLGASGTYSKTTGDGTYNDTDYSSTATDEQFGASWSQNLRFGANYSAALVYSDIPQQRDVSVLGPGLATASDASSWNSRLILSFKMPLLQRFGKEVNTAALVLAKSSVGISRQTLLLQSQLTIQKVENAYWDLLAARAALNVARESLKLAQDLRDLNKKKVEVGTLAPIEITQAEAGVAAREESVIIAETAVQNAQDNLLLLMAVPKEDPAWSQRILPTDRPEYQVRTVDVDATLAKALDLRPEMVNARQQLKNSELSERVARHETKHSLDLTASYTPSKLSSTDTGITTGQPPATTNQDSSARNWSIGLLYGFPISNRAAKANFATASLGREQAELGLMNTEQTIRVDVRTAARNVESGVKRVEAARSNTVLQRKTVEAEQKKYENGMSTSFEVLRIQNDLFSAQLAEIQAILSYMKSLTDLDRAQGTLLEARGLTLDAGSTR